MGSGLQALISNFRQRLQGTGSGRGVAELAEWLEWPAIDLEQWLKKKMPGEYSYRSFKIPKKHHRGFRRIDAPNDRLVDLQKRVYNKLLKPMMPPLFVTGFVPTRSIVDNARAHVDKEVVVNIDLKDFFTSISQERVSRFWMGIGWNRKAATILSQICCYQGHLPQGAPTSPALSNLTNSLLDSRLYGLVQRLPNGSYTRYADDLTFSFNRYDPQDRWFINKVEEILDEEGYEIQKKKRVRIQRQHQRQMVTGLVVNEKVNLPRKTRRKIRAMQHHRETGKLPQSAQRKLAGYEALLAMVTDDSSRTRGSPKPLPVSAQPLQKKSLVYEKYFMILFAVLSDQGNILGTGFLIRFQDQFYGVTCAHVVPNYPVGHSVTLNHFDPQIGNLMSRVIAFTAPKDAKPVSWTAGQDIAIFEILSPVPETLPVLDIQIPHTYSERADCWCFGYQRPRGVMLKEISTRYKVAGGFIELSHQGEPKIAQGTSGAPLFDPQFGIIGIVQSVLRQTEVAYLIPSNEILRVLESLH